MKKIILYFGLAVVLQFSPAYSNVQHVNIDPGVFSLNNGTLNEATAVILLNKAYQQNLLNQDGQHFPNPNCIKAKDLGGGGAQTLKLFAIQKSDACIKDGSPSHHDYQTIYILKEMSKGATEANNLAAVKNSELSALDAAKAKAEGLPIIALHNQLLDYQDSNKKNHVLTLLYAAEGHEVKSLQNQLAAFHRGESTNFAEYEPLRARLSNSFYMTGKALGRMHYKYMEPAGAIFGKTHVHADLHMENVFVQGEKVTFIDNETFTISLNNKQSISVDIMRFLLFTIAHPSQRYRHSGDIPADVWRQIAITPFIKGYIAGYPENKKQKVTQKLKELFLNISERELTEVWRGGNSSLLEKAKKEYLIPAFNELNK